MARSKLVAVQGQTHRHQAPTPSSSRNHCMTLLVSNWVRVSTQQRHLHALLLLLLL